MSDHDFGRGTGHEHPASARTPFPRRLLLIGTVKEGEEVQVRYWQARYPVEAAASAGVDAVEAFIGSGYYAISLEIAAADMQRVLAAYFNDARIREFHDHLSQFVDGLPTREEHYATADRFHDETPAGAGESDQGLDEEISSAELPFAASMYRWVNGEEARTGEDPHHSSSPASS